MNESLIQLLTDSLVAPVLTPERLVMEHAMLIGIMHVNIGMEVGASIIQTFVQQFHNLHSSRNSMAEEGKELDNYLQIISHLYAFKVIDAELILDILTSLAESFTPKDIELILLVLKATGFALRKDDPARLKSAILKIQEQSSRSSKEYENDSRTKFMLEVLVAIKNNNVKKIPNYDQEHLQMLQKNLRQFYRPDHSSFPLKIGLEDLVNADARGKWWLVGSAWAGNAKGPAANNRKKQMSASTSAGTKEASYSSDLMELARKMRMNTDTRKNIFCAILSAEDYLEAFEIVTKLNVPVHKEREVAFVLVDSCMNEKSFNPFYAHLLSKLCQFDRKYMIAAKFAIWDKIKDMHSLKKFRLENLAKFVSLMISLDSLGLSSLKVIEFADMDATCVRFLKIVLTDLLSHETSQRRKIFKSISSHAKLRILREGLGLFLRHFMLKDLDQKEKERFGAIIEEADGAMMAGEGKLLL
jgi:nucleolar MIF4G domain-containing protein 1